MNLPGSNDTYLMLLFLLLTINLIAGLFAPAPLPAQPSLLNQIIQSQTAIVSIKAENRQSFRTDKKSIALDAKTGRLVALQNIATNAYQRYGAGVIVHPSGVIVTNAHTINKADFITVVLHDNTQVPAKVVSFVNNLDFGLLKITPPYPLAAIAIADSDQIKLGEEVITVGNSEFLKQTVSGGKITGIGTNHAARQRGQTRTDLIQTTINLYHGDSGGPLFDRQGRLLGLMTAKETSADHSSFAIPSNKIGKYLIEYLQKQNAVQSR